MEANARPRVALAHDWLTGMRGGEKCLEVLCQRWPEAHLYTLLHSEGKLSPLIEAMDIRASFLQQLPAVSRYYRKLLPLMPSAIESFRLANYDLLVSFSHCVAKGIRPPLGVPHVCYCFTPMRYIWHMKDSYLHEASSTTKLGLTAFLGHLQNWDRQSSDRVSHFIAISKAVQQRIQECYGRNSVVIYPPVDTDFYAPTKVRREEYYLVVSALVPYKRIDLAIEACNRMGRHLLVIGSGPHAERLQALGGPTIRFAGWQSDEVIRDHFQRCRALLFPGEEDFGIVPVEAMACGCPVLAYGRGGATETVIPPESGHKPTGLWFGQQTVEEVAEVIQRFEKESSQFSPDAARRQALRFNKERFAAELYGYLDRVWENRGDVGRKAA